MTTDNGSGASSESTDSVDDSKGSIKPEDHKRAIDDLKKFKSMAKEHESNALKLQQELEAIKNKQLTDSNDYKALYEREKAARADVETKHKTLKENLIYNEKHKAATAALVTAGLRKDALALLDKEDFDDIVIETTSEGRMIPNGVDLYVESFKKRLGFAFEDKKQTKVNGGGGNNNNLSETTMTADEVYKIERKHGSGSKEHLAAVLQFKKYKTK